MRGNRWKDAHAELVRAYSTWQVFASQYKVKCYEDSMVAELRRTDDVSAIYLEGLKYFPVKLDLGSQPVQLLDSNGTTVREVDGRDKLKLDGETLRENLLYTFVEHTSRGQAHAPCAIIITLLLAIAAVRFSKPGRLPKIVIIPEIP
ncbi:unnamed protein product, partial [Nesidiocoris tenuis]